ncbi:MAG TPA: CerR family C-terminal domain-containing protein [Syntrophorhabdaceae bacterium]|nr:CerR family C-terminal domain-containing protein [Syntrophorhabdaceae bacterium]
MTKQTHSLPTKQRIIVIAGHVFAELGFENATIREICKQAQVNIAAINYHFGDKKRLYLAVLRYGKDMIFKRHPFDEESSRARSPEERFRLFVSWYVGRVREAHDEDSPWVRKLIMYELLRPTEGLDLLAEEAVRPIFKTLSSIIRELLGGTASEYTIRMCCASVIGQSLFYFYAQPMFRRLFPAHDFSNTDLIVDHVTKFSLSGFKEFARDRKGENR